MQTSITKTFCVWALGALVFLWPLAWNRSAVLFDDTSDYLVAGREAWSAAARVAHFQPKSVTMAPNVATAGIGTSSTKPHRAMTGRSPYYGAFAWAGRMLGGLQLTAALQAAWFAAALLNAMRLVGVTDLRVRLLGIVVLAGTTSLAFFTSVIMPDVFAGMAPLALCMIWFCNQRMSGWDWIFWTVNLVAAALFHTSFMLLAIVLVGCLTIAHLSRLRNFARPLTVCAMALLAGVIGTLAIDIAAARLAGAKLIPIPFLLARTIGDGTAAKLLQHDCGHVHYAACRYVPDLPLTESQFLWEDAHGAPWIALPLDERSAIAREQRGIVLEVVKRYPAEQLERSIQNAVTQLGYVSVSEFKGNATLEWEAKGNELAPDIEAFRRSRLWSGPPSLFALSGFWTLIYVLAIILTVLALSSKAWASRADPTTRSVIVWLLASVVISAAVHGVLSGVMHRYGARIAWLPMFDLFVIACAWRAEPRGETLPEAVRLEVSPA